MSNSFVRTRLVALIRTSLFFLLTPQFEPASVKGLECVVVDYGKHVYIMACSAVEVPKFTERQECFNQEE